MSKVKTSMNYAESETYICKKLDEKLLHKIKAIANELSNKFFPYDELCWILAEFQMIFEKGKKRFSENDVIKRFNKIYASSLTYDQICQLISILRVYLEEINLYP